MTHLEAGDETLVSPGELIEFAEGSSHDEVYCEQCDHTADADDFKTENQSKTPEESAKEVAS